MLDGYDFEVFKYDWLVVIINPIDKTKDIIINDPEKLAFIYERKKNEIWIGYNNAHYDQYIFKGILLGMNPKEINDFIIMQGHDGWQYSDSFKKIKMINYDVKLRNDTGLKSIEAFMGNNIKETSVPFDIDRKLTEAEINETVKYCTNDVEQTLATFIERKSEFDAALGLVKIFNLPLEYVGKTGAQRVAKILGGMGKHFKDDEFDFPIAPTLQLKKYKICLDWYKKPENHDYSKKQIRMICGIPHTLAWGGLHGATGKIQYKKDGTAYIKNEPYYGEGVFLMSDVTSYYPSLQLKYKFGYRNMGNPENFEKIHNENLRFKKAGDKKARLPYKIADNAISGQLKDPHSSLFDPRENNAVTVNGQLLLVDLLEKLEPYIEALIQSNTDGILIKLHSIKDYDTIDDIVWEWEHRTGMRMEFDIYSKVFQKDVNNYVLVAPDGHMKTKGAYTKTLSKVDYDLPIVNKALVDFMTKNVSVEKTIYGCDDFIQFQKVIKLTGKYWAVWHNGKYTLDKCHRVFASKDSHDTYIGKCKKKGATIEKFGNTPLHCFIFDDYINGLSAPAKLDKQWYVDLAYSRLKQYGIGVT